MTPPRDNRGRFIRRAAPAPLPPHVIFPVRRAVPPVSWPLQTRLRQPLNGGHRRQSLSPPSTICRMVMRMSLWSSPVCGCAGLPQPLSSNALAADTRAAGGAFSALAMPAKTLMLISV